MKRGVIVVHTGDGKGKSTAAFGVALRAAGHGQKIGLVQFIKGTWKTGEQAALLRFPEITHVVSGAGFTWEGQDRAQEAAAAQQGWQAAVAMIEAARAEPAAYDLVVLDELTTAIAFHGLALDEVLRVLRDKPLELSIVVTGRGAPAELIELADTVTEMRQLKHAFEASLKPRRGVDF
jgi:cob(I)alamin adenosyltransferase